MRLISITKRLTAIAIVAGIALPTATAASTPSRATPYPVKSAALAQQGQNLIWHVTLGHSFSPRQMGRTGRTLCLEIQQAGGKTHSACIAGPAGGRHSDRIQYTSPTRNPHFIRAKVTRGSRYELTAEFKPAALALKYKRLRWSVASTASGHCGTETTCGSGTGTPLRSLALHTPKLVGCVATGNDFVFSGSARAHDIALTFDDGPWPDPPSIDFVRLLHRYHVPATFFEIGDQIHEYDPTGSIERTMLKYGDMIGDHTWTHPDMTTLSSADQRNQIEWTKDAIRHATGFTPCLFRAPYGSTDPGLLGLARSLHFTTIQWDVDTVDWSLPGTPTIEQRAISGAQNGAIILQHFGGGPRYETYNAIPTEIKALRAKGYHFVTITKMLGYRLIYR